MSPPILLLVGVLLAVAVAGEFVAVSLLHNASRSEQRLAAARNDLEDLVRRQLVDEIGLRGYVATGQRSFLEEGTNAPAGELAARLRGELSDAGIEAARPTSTRSAARTTAGSVTSSGPLLTDPGRSDALAKQTQGKDLLQTMRREAAAIRDELQAADRDSASELGARITATAAVSIGTIAVFRDCGRGAGALAHRRGPGARARAVAGGGTAADAAGGRRRIAPHGGRFRLHVGHARSTRRRRFDRYVAGGAQRGWFLIADVSGKGIEAARHSAFVQYAIRTLAGEYDDPGRVLERFNALFLDTFDDPSVFVVAFLGAFDASSGVAALRQRRPCDRLHRAARRCRAASRPTGSIIGLDPGEAYGERSIRLVAGETIVLATDGLTECRDAAGTMLGDDGVMALLRPGAAGPQALCDRLVSEAQRRSQGDVSDDLAILVLRVLDTDVGSAPAPFSTIDA